jgi:hypothetical protein
MDTLVSTPSVKNIARQDLKNQRLVTKLLGMA